MTRGTLAMVKARMRKKVAAANQAATEMDGEDDPGSKEEADAELDATMSSLAGHQNSLQKACAP